MDRPLQRAHRAVLVASAVVLSAGCAACSSEPTSSDPDVESCIDDLRNLSDETGNPLGDAEAACEEIVARSAVTSTPGPGADSPNPLADPEGYAADFCRDAMSNQGLDAMAQSLGSAATPDAVARSYAAGVTSDIQPETESGCLRGILEAGG